MTKALVIGGGFGGCVAAHFLSGKNIDVTLVERASFLGGGCKTFFYGGHPYTVGPRHFLTQDQKLFDFLHQYVPMRLLREHEFLTYIEQDADFYHYPIHQDDIARMPDRDKIQQELENRPKILAPKNFEEYWVASIGPTLYGKFVDDYSKKMWGLETNTEIDTFNWSPKGVPIKSGPKAAWTEAISAFPIKNNGYDDYFEIATQDSTVLLNTEIQAFDVEKYRVKIDGDWHGFDIIVNTISPEIILNNAFGPLRWVGREFFKLVLPQESVFPEHVYFLYYAGQEPFTRAVEYKKFYNGYQSPTTLLGIEIPSFTNKLYPYTTTKDQAAAQKYLDALPERVFSMGRAGCYRYIDIDDIIQQGMDLAEKV